MLRNTAERIVSNHNKKGDQSFVNDKPVVVGAVDGLRPVLMAQAAAESCRNGGVFVKIPE